MTLLELLAGPAGARFVAPDFSFIPNKGHLLFYFRKPALRLSGATTLKDALSTKENTAGEITIRIENVKQAEELAQHLTR